MGHKKQNIPVNRSFKSQHDIQENTSHVDGTSGILYVVATPIGNLEDISIRAVSILKKVSLILAEDTRKFSILASKYEINTAKQSFFEHNEKNRVSPTINHLLSGKDVAIVSDAGTPGISDPGYLLIKACWENGITVSSVPGPCAAIAALSISGLPCHKFQFEGFVPVKEGKRIECIKKYLNGEVTIICYESPHRILKTLRAINAIDPDRLIFVIREISKIHEEAFRGSASNILESLEKRASIKGEFVIIFSGTRVQS